MKLRTVFSSLIAFVLLSTLNLTSFAQQAPQLTKLYYPETVAGFAYSPDSNTLAISYQGGKVRIWDAETGTIRHTLEHPNVKSVSDIAYSPDGKTLAAACDDWKVRLWDVATGALKNTLIGHTSTVVSVAYSPDGTTLVSSAWFSDNNLHLWDAETGESINVWGGNVANIANHLTYSPDGTILAVESLNRVFLWDVATGRLLHNFEGNRFAYSPDGTTLATNATGGGRTVSLWDIKTGTLLHRLTGHIDSVSYVVYSPDGKTLASGSYDESVRLWDVATGTLTNVLALSGAVIGVAYSPNGNTLITAGGQDRLRLWDATTSTLLHTFGQGSSEDPGILGVSSVVYSLDGTTIAHWSGAWGTIELWRLAPPPTPIIFTPSEVADQTFTAGTPVNLTLPFATGGTAPYTYTLTPLSNGLQFNPTTRELHGTPLTAMDATTLTYTATDASGRSESLTFNITVTAAPATGIITFSPNVIAPRTFVTGSPITPVLLPVATGGIAPYNYTLVPLPDGLAFDPATRQLTGTPTTVASTSTTYTVTDAASTTASLTFTINVIDGSTPGDVPDAALAAAIRRSLGLPADTALTTALINQLTNLDGYAQSITTLTGLEQATNLRTLDLGQNQIVDISALSSLTQLTHLYLDDNQIADISPLAGLRNLRLLRLARNPITDLMPLLALQQQNPGLDVDIHVPPRGSGVTFADANLEAAVRATLELRSADPLTTTTMLNLITLEAYDRRIASISGLEHATNLVALDLGLNQIVDISPLAGLTQLEVLYLDDNQIVDVSPLAGLTKLNTLFLRGNPIASLDPISHLLDDIRVFRARMAQ